MHVERTERIITQILRMPERFYMGSWIDAYTAFDDDDTFDACGTTCCIAGWAVRNDRLDLGAEEPEKTVEQLWHQEHSVDWIDTACELLGLDIDTGYTLSVPLFFISDWPDHYRELDGEAGEHVAAASLLRDMLDRTVTLGAADNGWWRRYAINT